MKKISKLNKLYKKAMDFYCEGKLEKSLCYCDKVLNMERGHAPTLNLKGLILYIKGNLDQAKYFWKLSYKLNGDMVSKKCIEDCRVDEQEQYIFNQGVILFNQIKIREALNCFLKCSKSDFNCLNLWCYIAKCYMQLGEYAKSEGYIDDVLKIDSKNLEARKLKTQLMELGVIDKKLRFNSKIVIVPVACIIICLLALGGYKGYVTLNNYLSERKLAKQINSDKTSENVENFQGNTLQSDENTGASDTEIVETVKEEENKRKFEADILKEYINSSDYENIIKYINDFKNDELSINDKSVFLEGKNLVLQSGINSLYEEGMKLIDSKQYEEAIFKLKLIYEFDEETYLNEHILFMLGSSYEALGDIESADSYYEKYADKYLTSGSYIGQCLYSLAINNEGINDEKSKRYAQLLNSNYEKSDYNNSKIKDIISR